MGITVDQAIATYIKLRSKRDRLEEELKEKLSEVKRNMEKIEQFIELCASEQGVKSFKTDSGTAFIQTKDFASVADWDVVLRFIQDTSSYDMLEKRVAKNAVRSYIDVHKAVPPGVNYGTRLAVAVRKPAKKIAD